VIQETYNEVARKCASNQRLIIAKCNVDKNNVPVDLYHIPTIKMYAVKNKDSPMEYFDRLTELDRYLQFIQEEGSSESDIKKMQRKKTRRKF
jgi:hypothetical protein